MERIDHGTGDAVLAFVVIGIPVMALCAIITRAMQYREKKLELEAQIEAAKAAAVNPRGDLLEQRVRVLERIVTDKGLNVAEEIERLRERPLS